MLPDAEQLRTAAASVERCWVDPLRERNEDMLARLPGAVLAAAAAEDRCWRALAPPTPSPNQDPAPTGDPAPTRTFLKTRNIFVNVSHKASILS